jgi:hypothetical protein
MMFSWDILYAKHKQRTPQEQGSSYSTVYTLSPIPHTFKTRASEQEIRTSNVSTCWIQWPLQFLLSLLFRFLHTRHCCLYEMLTLLNALQSVSSWILEPLLRTPTLDWIFLNVSVCWPAKKNIDGILWAQEEGSHEDISGICQLSTYLSTYGSKALVDLCRFLNFLIHTQSTGLLGRGISPSQGRYRHRINEQRHPCLEWESNPLSQRSSGPRRFMP